MYISVLMILCARWSAWMRRTGHLLRSEAFRQKPGNPEREDYEHRRCGVADLFVAFEPLACKRVVKLTDTRTAVDFAHFLRELIEVHYSHCEKMYWSWII